MAQTQESLERRFAAAQERIKEAQVEKRVKQAQLEQLRIQRDALKAESVEIFGCDIALLQESLEEKRAEIEAKLSEVENQANAQQGA